MNSEAGLRKLKQKHSATLLQTPGVCGVGIEQDADGKFVLAVHLAEDSAQVRAAVTRQLGEAPLKFIPSGPFQKF